MVKKITKKEYGVLNLAVSEVLKNGKITRTCPRCGQILVYESKGPLEVIRCKDPSCIKSIRRGI